jgi:hypothetical protein
MFEISDQVEKNSLEYSLEKAQQLSDKQIILKEFDKFIKIYEGLKIIGDFKKFQTGNYVVTDMNHETTSYKGLEIWHRTYRFLRKPKITKILSLIYDYSFMLPDNKVTGGIKDYVFQSMSLFDYNPELNDTYKLIFDEMQLKYEQVLADQTYKLRVFNAFNKLNF